jgi:8-oxo-dGTP pyrophosphatase MutT (NUDIX family)
MATGAGTTTWDGLPVSDALPHGATVVVFRRAAAGLELLLLHRAHSGPDYEGDWAWTPPAGARLPGEPVGACARRELWEETGLRLDVTPTDCGTEEWRVYVTEAPPGASVTLEHEREHDRYEWVPARVAFVRCRPQQVCRALKAAVDVMSRGAPFSPPP